MGEAMERKRRALDVLRLKSEIAGEDATAVEVYPPQSEVVDGADMYHLWVLPEPLPFSLATRTAGSGQG